MATEFGGVIVALDSELFFAFGVSAVSFWWFCSFRQFCFGGFVSVVSLALVSFWSFRWFRFAVSGSSAV